MRWYNYLIGFVICFASTAVQEVLGPNDYWFIFTLINLVMFMQYARDVKRENNPIKLPD